MDDKDAWLDDVRRWYFGGTEPDSYRDDPVQPPRPTRQAPAAPGAQRARSRPAQHCADCGKSEGI